MQFQKHKTETLNKANGFSTKNIPKNEAITKILDSELFLSRKNFQMQFGWNTIVNPELNVLTWTQHYIFHTVDVVDPKK